MARLIDADEVIRLIEDGYCRECDSRDGVMCGACLLDNAKIVIDSATAVDAVEVVRCKDCVYCEETHRFLRCDIMGDNLLPDFYCACGERKEKTDV